MEKLLEAHIIQQQEELLKLQILIHSLVDELIETNVINDVSLDDRIQKKIKAITDLVETHKKDINVNNIGLSNIFSGPMGEA
jgi:hypothetical protein